VSLGWKVFLPDASGCPLEAKAVGVDVGITLPGNINVGILQFTGVEATWVPVGTRSSKTRYGLLSSTGLADEIGPSITPTLATDAVPIGHPRPLPRPMPESMRLGGLCSQSSKMVAVGVNTAPGAANVLTDPVGYKPGSTN